MNKHQTPGPWIYDSGCIYASRDGKPAYRLASMDREEHETAPWERDANARLMARAPELLEICEEFAAAVDEILINLADTETDRDEGTGDLYPPVISLYRALSRARDCPVVSVP